MIFGFIVWDRLPETMATSADPRRKNISNKMFSVVISIVSVCSLLPANTKKLFSEEITELTDAGAEIPVRYSL